MGTGQRAVREPSHLFRREGNRMDENILAWNVTNWITIVLMAAIGFAALGFVRNWYAKKHGGA